ncbi:MAG TPA: protein kinase [Gemmataceae bacterium]|jgi:uncharacterized RDD family membrane protein YckC
MQVTCPHCQNILEYADQRPSFCSRCGCRLNPPPETPTSALDPAATEAERRTIVEAEAPPERVGGYRLLRPLGSGGMGAVYEAEDTASGRRVALKLLSPDFAGSAEAVERFRREGRLASTLSHPRCVFVLAADEESGRPYIVMELMPGRTLEDLVADEGPLDPAAAVARILDVLDGLQEAHRLGFIHRDVKPSNCFLDSEGRVKVGDFGLAKSLIQDTNLTRTGSFLGTLLFAAPEQIKGEPVDAQTDVYSVAATLYYLLTGQAPFAGGDAAATLARTVSESVPPMRRLRPELDPALDAVVRRGLERERSRRWRGLAEFKAALLLFQPEPLPFAALGIRFVAYFLDSLFILLTNILLMALLMTAALIRLEEAPSSHLTPFLALAVNFLYFALMEGLWGASLGKRLLGLRVRKASAPKFPPKLAQAFLRTALFEGLLNLGTLIGTTILLVYAPSKTDDAEWARTAPLTYMLASLLPLVGQIAGIVALLAPMRARNGYRGLHEWLSGTRVVHLPRPEKRRGLVGRPCEWPVLRPDGLPEVLGPFVIRGALRWNAGAKVLLGQDRGLDRAVWIWLRPQADAPLSATRRDISRPTRLRWLACGRHADWQWDAFMAFNGGPIPRHSRRGEETWPRALPLLEQLADELATASAEGTLPDTLHPDQVWVGPDGQVQLLDRPLAGGDGPAEGVGGPGRALALLADAAALTLEGRPRAAGSSGPLQAPVPLHVRPLLDRLMGAGKPYRDVGEFQTNLKAIADQPAEVGAPRRARHLIVLGAFLFVGLASCMMPAGWSNQFLPSMVLGESIRKKERRLEKLEQGALLDVVRAVNPDLLVRLQGAVQLDADYPLRDHLRQSLDRDRRRYAARLESHGWLSRQILERMEKQFEAHSDATETERGSADDRELGQMEEDLTAFSLVTVLIWPALWVVWAFLARGGFSYRMAGIALVRGDGRPASRLQCAWRALLVWTPLTGLLVLSLWLESRYWSAWELGDPPRWMLSLASASWYAALLLLAGYAILALWWPARMLHDRLAGTYRVPR